MWTGKKMLIIACKYPALWEQLSFPPRQLGLINFVGLGNILLLSSSIIWIRIKTGLASSPKYLKKIFSVSFHTDYFSVVLNLKVLVQLLKFSVLHLTIKNWNWAWCCNHCTATWNLECIVCSQLPVKSENSSAVIGVWHSWVLVKLKSYALS